MIPNSSTSLPIAGSEHGSDEASHHAIKEGSCKLIVIVWALKHHEWGVIPAKNVGGFGAGLRNRDSVSDRSRWSPCQICDH